MLTKRVAFSLSKPNTHTHKQKLSYKCLAYLNWIEEASKLTKKTRD